MNRRYTRIDTLREKMLKEEYYKKGKKEGFMKGYILGMMVMILIFLLTQITINN